ncbi:MAG TPA: hypothetical protein V6D33_12545 [Cyanophyceae cyanobacterium]
MPLDLTDNNQLVVRHTSYYQKTSGNVYDFEQSDSTYVMRLGEIHPYFRKPEFIKEPPAEKVPQQWTPPLYGGENAATSTKSSEGSTDTTTKGFGAK